MKKKYVAYYRVSTKKQGQSGLGLESQQSQVKAAIGQNELIGEYTEVESGKKNDRSQLIAAIAFAKANGAILIIAKLDRLSRNAAFIFTLRDSGCAFECADMPQANTLTIGMFATLAQYERELISKRTKDALKAKKDRGFKLGKPENLTEEAREKGAKSNKNKAASKETQVAAFIKLLRKSRKTMTLRTIATKLNEAGFKTGTGKSFFPIQVSRIEKRAA